MEDALRRQAGVQDVEVAIQSNMATITPARDRYVDLRAVPRAVKNAGFTPGRMTLRAEGTFETAGSGVAFRIRGWPESFAVHGDSAHAAGTTDEIDAAVEYRRTPIRLYVRDGSDGETGG